MVDRLHPGAGINSFLRDNSVLNNFESRGKTISIDKVASADDVMMEEHTVPVTEYDTMPKVTQEVTAQDVGQVMAPVAAPPVMAEQAVTPVTEGYCSEGCPYKKHRSPTNTLLNNVEQFCDEHWHGVTVSIVVTIVIIAISITVMIFLGMIKIKKCCCKGDECCCKGLKGGDDEDDDDVELTGADIF